MAGLWAGTCRIQHTFDGLIDKSAVHDGLDVHGRKDAREEASIDNGSAREGTLRGCDVAEGKGMGIAKCQDPLPD